MLLDDGSLVDTTLGEEIPEDKQPMPVTSAEQIAQHRVVDSEAMNDIIQRTDDFNWQKNTCLAKFDGVEEAALVGAACPLEDLPASKLHWSHNFVVRALKLSQGAKVDAHIRFEEEVIFIHQGQMEITVDGETLLLEKGDTFTTPIEATRSFNHVGEQDCISYITRRTDHPAAPKFI